VEMVIRKYPVSGELSNSENGKVRNDKPAAVESLVDAQRVAGRLFGS